MHLPIYVQKRERERERERERDRVNAFTRVAQSIDGGMSHEYFSRVGKEKHAWRRFPPCNGSRIGK
jgi:hypothetical protein